MSGVLDTVKFAGVLVLAIPPALAGLELLVVRGQPLPGGALVGLAIALVVVQRRLTTPGDVPGLLVRRLFGTVMNESDSEQRDADEQP